MKFKGKMGKYWYVVIGILDGITIAGILYAGFTKIILMSMPLWIIANLYFIPVIFKNEVMIDKKQVIIQFGLLQKVVLISNITMVRKMRDYSASFAADIDRVCIQPKGRGSIFISVDDNNAFIKELMKKNKRIKYIM